MKLDNPIFIVVDANGDFIGAYTTEAIADSVANYHGASVTKITEVFSEDNQAPIKKHPNLQ